MRACKGKKYSKELRMRLTDATIDKDATEKVGFKITKFGNEGLKRKPYQLLQSMFCHSGETVIKAKRR